MADDDRPGPPAAEQVDHRLPPVAVEVVGRLVEQEEVGVGEDEGGEPGPRPLPPGERGEPRVRRDVEPEAAEGGDAGFLRPIDVGQLVVGRLTPLGAAEGGERVGDAEQVGHRLVRVDLDGLPEDGHAAADGHPAGAGAELAGDEPEQGGLAHAVAADQASPGGAEGQAEAREERPAVGGGVGEVGQGDGSGHACGVSGDGVGRVSAANFVSSTAASWFEGTDRM